MYRVNINELTFKCIIGILPYEREQEQRVVVDLSFEYLFDVDRSNFIDYSKVAYLVESIMVEKKFQLLEEAIIYIKKELNREFKLKNLTLKITKPDVLPNCIVSVEG